MTIAAFHRLASGSAWQWEPPPLVNVLIAAYGIVHVIALAFLILSNKGEINVGLISTLAAYAAILFIPVKGSRSETGKPGGVAEI